MKKKLAFFLFFIYLISTENIHSQTYVTVRRDTFMNYAAIKVLVVILMVSKWENGQMLPVTVLSMRKVFMTAQVTRKEFGKSITPMDYYAEK